MRRLLLVNAVVFAILLLKQYDLMRVSLGVRHVQLLSTWVLLGSARVEAAPRPDLLELLLAID